MIATDGRSRVFSAALHSSLPRSIARDSRPGRRPLFVCSMFSSAAGQIGRCACTQCSMLSAVEIAVVRCAARGVSGGGHAAATASATSESGSVRRGARRLSMPRPAHT